MKLTTLCKAASMLFAAIALSNAQNATAQNTELVDTYDKITFSGSYVHDNYQEPDRIIVINTAEDFIKYFITTPLADRPQCRYIFNNDIDLTQHEINQFATTHKNQTIIGNGHTLKYNLYTGNYNGSTITAFMSEHNGRIYDLRLECPTTVIKSSSRQNSSFAHTFSSSSGHGEIVRCHLKTKLQTEDNTSDRIWKPLGRGDYSAWNIVEITIDENFDASKLVTMYAVADYSTVYYCIFKVNRNGNEQKLPLIYQLRADNESYYIDPIGSGTTNTLYDEVKSATSAEGIMTAISQHEKNRQNFALIDGEIEILNHYRIMVKDGRPIATNRIFENIEMYQKVQAAAAEYYSQHGENCIIENVIPDLGALSWTVNPDFPITTLPSEYTIDGKGQTISPTRPLIGTNWGVVKNLNIEIADAAILHTATANNPYYGLVSRVNIGTIENVQASLQGVSIDKDGASDNAGTFGVIVGSNQGRVENCNIKGDMTISETASLEYVGGIAGRNQDGVNIGDCLSTLTINNQINAQAVAVNYISGDNSGKCSNVFYASDGQGYGAPEGATEVYRLDDGAQPEDGKLYYNKPDFITNFSNLGRWKFNATDNMPELTFSDITVTKPDTESQPITIEVTNEDDLELVTDYIFNAPEVFSNANINITSDIEMTEVETPDADSYASLPAFSGFGSGADDNKQFTGTINGSTTGDDGEQKGITISNFSANMGGSSIFSNIAKEANISGINFENAKIYNPKTVEVTDPETGDQKNVIAIFGDSNEGTIKNCSFSGTVVIDGTEQEICLVADNKEGAVIEKCLFYIDYQEQPAATTGNKSCIVLKQNIGIGRNTGTVKKVAINKPKSGSSTQNANKTFVLLNPAGEPEDLEKDVRAFTDEELASGEAAYWLNYDEKGYSGKYSPIWKKGVKQPVLAKNGANDAVYKLDIFCNNTEAGVSGPKYANGGETVTVSYADMPQSIMLSGNTIPAANYTEGEYTFVMPLPDVSGNGEVSLKLAYTATGIADASGSLSIAAQGNAIAISGAEGTEAYIYNAAGQMVSRIALNEGNGTATISGTGLHIVKAGNQTAKVMLK